MEEPHTDPRVTFARQRRNLLAASLVLLGFQWVGATFDKLSLFGNTIHLKAPLDITGPLWVLWFYLALRTYQHFRAIPGNPVTEPFRDRVAKEMQAGGSRIAAKELRSNVGHGMANPSKATLVLKGASITGYESTFWVVVLDGEVSVRDLGGNQGHATMMLENHAVQVPTSHLALCKFKAAGWLSINTPVVTEYILPAVVAVLPVLRWGYSWIAYYLATWDQV